MKSLLIVLLLSLGINAKTVTGTIDYAYNEEGVLPWVGIITNGKKDTFIYNGKYKTSYIEKQKGKMIKVYFQKNGEAKEIEFLNKKTNVNKKTNKKVSKNKSNLPFIGKKQTKDGRTKIVISKNGNIKINTHFKNGYKVNYNGKYTSDFIIPKDTMTHSWKVSKDKVCQGYRNAWNCEKLYKK